jgi:hypothetical protein
MQFSQRFHGAIPNIPVPAIDLRSAAERYDDCQVDTRYLRAKAHGAGGKVGS